MRQLFRNSARLSEDHAALVEFTETHPDEPDLRIATRLSPIASECQTYIIRRLENLPHGGQTYTTSIWTISDDGSTRVQQRLPEAESIPLLSVFRPEKVSLSGEISLHHYSETWEHLSETQTAWVNYIFDTAEAAKRFQSAIFGRNLLDSFTTAKSIVVHQGIRGAFAFEEQMCGIESLRIWEDNGLSLPSARGGIMALIHLSPSFGEGWIKFWLNNSRHQARVRDDSGRTVKIKDLDIRITQPGMARRDSIASREPKRATERNISGMRIEFPTDDEKTRFLALVKKIQGHLVPLPEVY